MLFLLFISKITIAQEIDIKNFVVTANPNLTYTKGDRFDFKFDIKGTYDYLDLFVYYESENRSNLLGLIYWNRDRDRPINFPDYATKNTWFNSFLDRTVIIPGKKFILLAKYNGQEKRLIYPTPLPDGDNDGVPDINDQCPNQPGPASNNGCPLPQNPNLAVDLDASAVFSQCLSCPPPLDAFFSSGKKHLIANGGTGSISFNKLEIRNIGNTTSNSAKIDFYFSIDNSLSTSNDKLIKSINIPSRNVNSSFGIQTSITGWDINNNGGLANGNYFILVNIDAANSNNEGTSGEADNLLTIPITYTTSNIFSIASPVLISEQKSTEAPYKLEIYNIQGSIINNITVINKKEEDAYIQNLPKGFYIIKKDDETYKVAN